MPFPGQPFRAIMSRAFQRYYTIWASQFVTDDKLGSQATAEWPTTKAEPAVNPTIDPIIESIFEKKEASTDLSQKYEEASTSSPFKQISADQIEEQEDGEAEPVINGSQPTHSEDSPEESSSEPEVSPVADQPAADISEAVVNSPDEPVLEQPVAASPEPELSVEPEIVSTAAINPEANEPQQPVVEPVAVAPAVPEPPPISVDSMISNSMGNIFQKKVAKDPILKALLDRHSDEDMQSLADDLREFAEDIGASDKSE